MKKKTIRRGLFWVAAVCLMLAAVPGSGKKAAAQPAQEQTVVGYYAGWAAGQGYTPDKVPAEQLTQVNYAFAAIDEDSGAVILPNPSQDGANLAGLRALKARNSGLQVVLSVGGWDYSAFFSSAASSAARREVFAQSCLDLILEHGLDGVDLDWEYPVSGGAPGTAHSPNDRQNFTLLLQAVRQKLDAQSLLDGRTYRLTIAGGIGAGYLNCIEPQAVAETVDHIFLMAYDIHGPWDSYTDLCAPLYTPKESAPQYRYSVSDGVSAWLDKGVPPDKLVLGMPLYGYIYQNAGSQNNGLYRTFTSARSISYDEIQRAYLDRPAYEQFFHDEAQVPYLSGNGIFLSYENEASVSAKGALARSQSLGGIGFWELSQNAAGDLIQSACSAFFGSAPFRDVSPNAWYAGAVSMMYEAGLMEGTAPGAFSPALPATRGTAVTLLYRLAGSPAVSGASFPDVAADSYCSRAVIWAKANGLAQGGDDGSFRPDEPVTRQQLAVLLWRYVCLQNQDSGRRAELHGFRDAAQVGDYAAEAVQWAVAEGLLQGTDGGMLEPNISADRSQIAALFARLLPTL